MAQCKQTPQEFLQTVFSPMVAVLCSPDAELLCQKNNLSFVELVQPFCRLTAEATLRDPTNQVVTVRNLRIVMKDMNAVPPQPSLAKKLLNDAVSSCQFSAESCRMTTVTSGDYEIQLPTSLPWFEAFRDCFFEVAYPSDHEFIKHFLACILVVSSSNVNPIDQFNKLSQQQHQHQHHSPSKLPKWFFPNTYKCYVLLHDIIEADQNKAESAFQTMKSTYVGNFCHLLQINSQSGNTVLPTSGVGDQDGAQPPDPWSQFLSKKIDQMDTNDYDSSPRTPQEDSAFPSKLCEGSSELDISSVTEVATEVTETNEVIHHPLSPDNDLVPTAYSPSDKSEKILKVEAVNEQDAPLSSIINHNQVLQEKSLQRPHGLCLTVSDMDRIRIFIHEFAVRGLLPFVEKQMKLLNEAVAARKSLHRSFFSATKKWFGGNKPGYQGPNSPANSVVYSQEATELQVRRLGDLAFMFQQYELAYQAYHTAKRDFNNDQAWLYFAGALEMAGLSVFMQGSSVQRQYPFHYMDSAISTYFNTCKKPQFATRATLLSTECLKNKGMFGEAAKQFIKMTSEDSDLRSALLLEQAAHCFVRMRTPMIRKYAFHMILAGHRFSKAGQRKHALRAYKQAYQVYKAKNWSLAEDHINFTIGRQSFNLKQLDQALSAFRNLLTRDSQQSPSQQGAFLREFLFVYKQLLSQENVNNGVFPILPVPIIDCQATKVILGHCHTFPEDGSVLASSVSFDDNESLDPKWFQLEELAVLEAQGALPIVMKYSVQRLNNKTDNTQCHLAIVKEPITVELQLANPLKIPLSISNLFLLWSFTSVNYEKGKEIEQEGLLTNEKDSIKNTVSDEVIHTDCIKSLILDSSQTKKVHLVVTPQQTGRLKILGINYHLGSYTPNQTVDVDSNTKPASYASTITVQGKQYVDIEGPRLNITKAEKSSIVRGPDYRLEHIIIPEMPCLKVSFYNFPESVLCGEVQQIVVNFVNIGSHAITKLYVSSPTPEIFSFGRAGVPYNSVVSSSPKHTHCASADNVYIDFVEKPRELLAESPIIQRVCLVPLPDGLTSLQPGHSCKLPIWIRGPDQSGIHNVDFLFYYESSVSNPKLRYRVLRHSARLIASNSISVEAVAIRSHTLLSSDNLSSLAVAMEVENMNEVHDSCITEINIMQISSASQNWVLQSMSSPPTCEIQVCSRETVHLCFRAVRLHPSPVDENENVVVFSNIPFGNREIDSSATPCSDFCHRSLLRFLPLSEELVTKKPKQEQDEEKPTEEQLNNEAMQKALQVGLTVIVLWKAFIVDSEGVSRTVVGQHHITVDTINTLVSTHPEVKPEEEKPPVVIIPDPDQPPPPSRPTLSAVVLTQLVQSTVQHPHGVDYNFALNRTCKVPVNLVVHNCSQVPLQVLMDTTRPSERTDPGIGPDTSNVHLSKGPMSQMSGYLSTYQAPISATFAWVGATQRTVSLQPRETLHIPLQACFFSPGTYNLGNVYLGARKLNSATDEPMVPQRPCAPSLIVINNMAHPT